MSHPVIAAHALHAMRPIRNPVTVSVQMKAMVAALAVANAIGLSLTTHLLPKQNPL
jgi:hypothetical protein